MHIESPTMEQPQPIPALSLEETNRIQLELGTEGGMDLEKWIQENSEHFRAILDTRPELADLYRREPEKFKKILKKMLRESSTLH